MGVAKLEEREEAEEGAGTVVGKRVSEGGTAAESESKREGGARVPFKPVGEWRREDSWSAEERGADESVPRWKCVLDFFLPCLIARCVYPKHTHTHTHTHMHTHRHRHI